MFDNIKCHDKLVLLIESGPVIFQNIFINNTITETFQLISFGQLVPSGDKQYIFRMYSGSDFKSKASGAASCIRAANS